MRSTAADRLVIHPLGGWRQNGLWSTWATALERIRELKVVKDGVPLRGNELLRKMQPRFVSGVHVCKDRLQNRVDDRWRTVIEDEVIRRLFLSRAPRAAKAITSAAGPSASAAYLRLLLQFKESHKTHHHHAGYCWCHEGHLTSHIQTRLRMGCYGQTLASVQKYRWLRDCAPDIWLRLATRTDVELNARKLGELSLTLANGLHY
eukprot:6459161-Amphidinium_carterae.3